MGRAINLTGLKFGRLTAIQPDRKRNGKTTWKCICTCGNEKVITTGDLRSGRTKSCGCFLSESSKKRMTKHGLSNDNMYYLWQKMIERCTRKEDKDYHHYGGRGIKVCDDWLDFNNFHRDMAPRPDGMTIDRIDNNGDYTPENCRWATRKQQNNNTRRNIVLRYRGIEMNLKQWAEYLDVEYTMLQKRYSAGWSVERILTEPSNKKEAK